MQAPIQLDAPLLCHGCSQEGGGGVNAWANGQAETCLSCFVFSAARPAIFIFLY